jgi:hypothetical protein
LANLFAENPRRPVFWLVDGDDDLQWQTSHELVEKRWHISYITTVQVPSGDLLHMRYVPEKLPLVRIHLMRLRT